jgi:hypothetical protein
LSIHSLPSTFETLILKPIQMKMKNLFAAVLALLIAGVALAQDSQNKSTQKGTTPAKTEKAPALSKPAPPQTPSTPAPPAKTSAAPAPAPNTSPAPLTPPNSKAEARYTGGDKHARAKKHTGGKKQMAGKKRAGQTKEMKKEMKLAPKTQDTAPKQEEQKQK